MTPADRKAAQQREAQNLMIAADAIEMQATVARFNPLVFGDPSKCSVIVAGRVVVFDDLARLGPGPQRPEHHGV